MSESPLGLLYVASDPGSNLSDAKVKDWYDDERDPTRMAISSFKTASRWKYVRDSDSTGQSGEAGKTSSKSESSTTTNTTGTNTTSNGDGADTTSNGDGADTTSTGTGTGTTNTGTGTSNGEGTTSTSTGNTAGADTTETGGHPPYRKECSNTPYLALYEVDTWDVLSQTDYTKLAEDEKKVLSHIALLDRRTYNPLGEEVVARVADYDAHHPGPYLLTMEIEVDKSLEADLNKWYKDEHIPLLAKVPGWRRSRRYVLRDADPPQGSDAEKVVKDRGEHPPKYLALHEWASLDNFATPEFKKAISTSERMRLFKKAKVWGGRRWKLTKAWVQK